MLNGISDEVRFNTSEYKEGYLQGVKDSVQAKKESDDKQKEGLEIRKSKELFKVFIDEECGNFYFNYYKRLEGKIENQYIVRFLYLCTYLDYNNNLVVRSGNRNVPIYEEDLQGILRLGRTETYKTKTILIDCDLIHINDKGVINVNEKYCKKGDIINNGKIEKVRIFNDGFRCLYEKALPKEHKKISLLISLLPYINLQYNIICKNTKETVLENIEPYTLKEMCSLLSCSNVTKLKKDLLSLTIDNSPVISFHETINCKLIAVNPKVYYKGTKIECLEWLIGLFKIKG